MKKASITIKHQARRARALARFSIKPYAKGQDPTEYAAYVERKNVELAALQARVRDTAKSGEFAALHTA